MWPLWASVNGPGEAEEADVGIAWGGLGKGTLFKKGKVIDKGIAESELLQKLMGEVSVGGYRRGGYYVLATTTDTDESGPQKPGAINGGFFPKKRVLESLTFSLTSI